MMPPFRTSCSESLAGTRHHLELDSVRVLGIQRLGDPVIARAGHRTVGGVPHLEKPEVVVVGRAGSAQECGMAGDLGRDLETERLAVELYGSDNSLGAFVTPTTGSVTRCSRCFTTE